MDRHRHQQVAAASGACPASASARAEGLRRRRSPRYLRAWMASRTGPVNAAHHSSWTRPGGSGTARPTGHARRLVQPPPQRPGASVAQRRALQAASGAGRWQQQVQDGAHAAHHRGRLVSRGYHPGRWAATTLRPAADGQRRRSTVERGYGRLIAFAARRPGPAAAAVRADHVHAVAWAGASTSRRTSAAAQRLARGDSDLRAVLARRARSGPGPTGCTSTRRRSRSRCCRSRCSRSTAPRPCLVPAARSRCWCVACAVMPVRPTVRCLIVRGRRHHLAGARRHEPGQRERARHGLLAFIVALARPTAGLGRAGARHDHPADPGPAARLVACCDATGGRSCGPSSAGIVIVLLSLPFVGIGGYTRLHHRAAQHERASPAQPTTWTSARPWLRLGGGPLGASLALYGGYRGWASARCS